MAKRIYVSTITMIMLFTMITNCYSVANYSGDGQLIDNGFRSANERYVLDLGDINLKKQNTYTYRIVNLPTEDFVIGIQINVTPNNILLEKQNITGTIFIELLGHKNKVIIRNESSLGNWVWSTSRGSSNAFLYIREKPSTYFKPVKNSQYDLRFTILKPDSSDTKYEAKLLIKSGGWK